MEVVGSRRLAITPCKSSPKRCLLSQGMVHTAQKVELPVQMARIVSPPATRIPSFSSAPDAGGSLQRGHHRDVLRQGGGAAGVCPDAGRHRQPDRLHHAEQERLQCLGCRVSSGEVFWRGSGPVSGKHAEGRV